MPTSPLKTPAGYVPQMAIAIANPSGDADLVSAANPMPIQMQPALAAPPLTGTLASSALIGPFSPRAGRPVFLVLRERGADRPSCCARPTEAPPSCR